MKRIAVASIIAATFCSAAIAQSIITIVPEQRERIKSYVETNKDKIEDVFVREKATVGSTLPNDVPLSSPPADWGADLSNYGYIHFDNQTAIVDPSSRRILSIIE